jgi:hypothetical protein
MPVKAVDTILQLALTSCEGVRQAILSTTLPFSDSKHATDQAGNASWVEYGPTNTQALWPS